MRKDTFKKYMEGGSKYLSLQQLEQMTLEQRAEFRKYHNHWVVWLDEISDENYIKLNELLNEDNKIDYGQMW